MSRRTQRIVGAPPVRIIGLIAALALGPARARAQLPAGIAAERATLAEWLSNASVSPRAAIATVDVGAGGVAIPGAAGARAIERDGSVWLDGAGRARVLPAYRAVTVGSVTVVASGDPGRRRLTVFGPPRAGPPPEYYPYDSTLVFTGPLRTIAPLPHRVLTPDGLDVAAAEVGSVAFRLSGRDVRLRVMRIPEPGTEESSLEIYFRDATSGAGSYPAGRFLTLAPIGNGRYRADFNRARNPFCAYGPAYPCPVPWAGNTIASPVRAGERYTAH